MKLKQMTAALLAAAIPLLASACTSSEGGAASDTASNAASSIVSASSAAIEEQDGVYFSDGDLKDVSAETPNATITLSGSTGTISDTTRGSSGQTVTITSKGIYRVTGSSENVSIVIDDEQASGNVYLVLDGVSMTNATAPCIVVESADKVVIQCVGDSTLTYTAASADYDGAIYAKDDLTVNGSGSLTVTSALHGIVGNDDVKLTGAAVTVTAGSIGIKANDSVRIGGGTLSIDAGHDGIQVSSDDGTGFFYLESASVTVAAGYDGIDVGFDDDTSETSDYSGYVLVGSGTLDVTAGGGSSSAKNSNTSQKGIKCDGDIHIDEASAVTVSSADDALHSAANIEISGGTLALSSSDDGVHADNALMISGGEVTVSRAYEGLEAYEVTVSGGTVSVTASDDGINAAGGSDTTSTDTRPSMWGGSSSSGTLTISGGTVYVNSRGDGLDSNGSIYVTGGTVIVEGPTDNGNGALDKGDGGCVVSITGGTVLATGSSGMAMNFDSGTQCSALVGLSGSAGTTITVDDGSGFTFTTTKAFSCLVYSSPSMTQGSAYTVTAGGSRATMDFSSGLYASNVASMGGGMGGMGSPGGMGGRP